MITETGIVTASSLETAWIKTTRSGACESCSSRGSCGTATHQKEMIVSVKNTLKVKEGDYVVIGVETRPIMLLAFMLYVLPIILLIIGAFIGNSIALAYQMNPTGMSMLSGFALFSLSFIVIRLKNKSLSQNNSYKPFLVRKKMRTIPVGCINS